MAKGKRKLPEAIEAVFQQLEYKIRYEKGNFQSGYCIVENSKIVVINKFFDVEGRINSLTEILLQLKVDPTLIRQHSPETAEVVEREYAENALF